MKGSSCMKKQFKPPKAMTMIQAMTTKSARQSTKGVANTIHGTLMADSFEEDLLEGDEAPLYMCDNILDEAVHVMEDGPEDESSSQFDNTETWMKTETAGMDVVVSQVVTDVVVSQVVSQVDATTDNSEKDGKVTAGFLKCWAFIHSICLYFVFFVFRIQYSANFSAIEPLQKLKDILLLLVNQKQGTLAMHHGGNEASWKVLGRTL